MLTLDGFGLSHCHLIKIDVEGMELQVLLGAQETLRRHRPILFVENNGPNGSPQVIDLLRALGYTLRWHFSPFFQRDNFAGNSENVFGPMVDANMLALPQALAETASWLEPVLDASDTAEKALARLEAR